jgi:hypothetical protein
VWGTNFDLENIVWGTSGGILDDLVWGTATEGEDVTWGSSDEDAPLFDDPSSEPVNFDLTPLDDLFLQPVPPPVAPVPPPSGPGGGF